MLYIILFGTIIHVFTSSVLYFHNIVAKHQSISTAESSASEFVKVPLLLLYIGSAVVRFTFKVCLHGEGVQGMEGGGEVE